MKRFVVIPLVVTMLAALAVPVLAQTDTITQTGTGTSFDVFGKYIAIEDDLVVYSVDIEWGSMQATYKYYSNTTGKWNPKTHQHDDLGSSGYGVWEWADSDNGLKGNEIKISNHSEAALNCTLNFQPKDDFSGTGSFENTTNGTLFLVSGTQYSDPNNPELPKITKLNLTSSIPSTYVTPKSLGTVFITIDNA